MLDTFAISPKTFEVVPHHIGDLEEHQILVRVHYTALNRADLLQHKGLYPPPPGVTDVIGLELVGQVEAIGSQVTKWKLGDFVMALVSGGAHARHCVVQEDQAMSVPTNLDLKDAAGIAEVWLTAFQLLCLVGRVATDEVVLIHAGASGVGTAAVQLSKKLGVKSIVTLGSDEKADYVKKLGADLCVNYKKEDFVAKVKEFTNGKGVNVILDCIGAEYWERNIESLALDGRWVLYGTMGGIEVNGPILGKLMRKRGSLLTTTLRSRDNNYKARLVQEFSSFALSAFETGEFKTIIDSVYDFTKIKDAFARIETNQTIGKIVIDMRNI